LAAADPYGDSTTAYGYGGGLGGAYDQPSGVTDSAAASGGEWISYIDDESGKEYWYNEATDETSWSPR
jgi:hypothetical protein